MMFRNSYRLLLANFVPFWKDFLYKVIVVAITFLLTLPVLSYITSLSTYSNLSTEFQALSTSFPFVDMPTYLTQIYNFLNLIFESVANLFVANAFVGIYLTILYLIVFPFFVSLSELAVSEVLYGFMASQTKYGYTASFIRKMGKSSVFAIFKTLISLPFAFLAGFAFYGMLHLNAISIIPVMFVPILLLLLPILIYGFKLTLFSGWAPSIIVFNTGVFKGMGKGMIAIFRRFFKAYSTVCMILLVNILVLTWIGFMSFILILPLLSLSLTIFQMVMFFGSQGMRYYVDTDTILSPKKLEETDKLKHTKSII